MSVEVNLRTRELLEKLESPELWRYAASEWHRLYRQYVPYQEGALYSNIIITADRGKAQIEHTVPYAHYIYEGKVYGPSIPIMQGGAPTGYFSPKTPKHSTGKALTYSTVYSGKATKHWDVAAIPTQLPLLEQSIENYIKVKL